MAENTQAQDQAAALQAPSFAGTLDNEAIRHFSGIDKAAVMLLSLDESTSEEVLKLLDEPEIKLLTSHAARLRAVTMDQMNAVRQEFLMRVSEASPLLVRRAREQLKGVLKKILPADRYEKFIQSMESDDGLTEGFESIKWIDSQTVAAFLRHEHPQTTALVLAHLETEKVVEIVSHLPEGMRPEIAMRIAKLDRINPELVRDIQDIMIGEIMASGGGKSKLVGGTEAVAEILNQVDSMTEEQIFNVMEEEDPEMAESIRELMFVFDDLVKVDDRGIQAIMKEVTNDILTLSLKTCPDELREKIFRNISSRAAEMIKEDLAVMGPVKLADVEKAQQEIIKICRRLESEGKLSLGAAGGGGGEVFV